MSEDAATSAKGVRTESAGAWNALALVGGMIPGVQAIAQGVARNTVQRLMGYWFLVHLYGGWRALRDAGVMSEATYYRQRREFAQVFGLDVEEFAPALAAAVRSAALAGGAD